MPLDVITLYWVLGLCYCANLLFSVLLYTTGIVFSGAKQWIVAQFLLALGIMLLSFRSLIPYPLLATGNTLVFSANLIYLHAVWLFGNRERFDLRLYGSILAFFLVFIGPLRNAPINTRVAIFSLFCMVGSMAVYLVLVSRIKRCHYRGAWWAVIPFLFISIGHLVQFFGSLFSKSAQNLDSLNPVYSIVILASILTAPVSLFGYFLLAGIHKQELMEEQQAKLAEANQELRKLNQTKDLFVSILAHDLRNPLAGAARFVRKHLLASDIALDKKQYALEVLAISLEKTHSFLENVLWWSRAQRESWAKHKTNFDLETVLQTAVSIAMPSATDKSIKIVTDYRPAPVFADPDTVLLILHNLLSNALKFSQPGGVVEVGTGNNSANSSYVYVTDHGIGIKPEIREKLLQIEAKVSTPGTLGETGSGMGLILCWEFAKRNNARLVLTSEPGIGTTVRLTFPG